MVSTCVDPVLDDLQFLRSNLSLSSRYLYYVEILQQNFRLLRTFLLSVRKWQKKAVYLGCNYTRNLSLRSSVSSAEDTVKKYAVDIHSLCPGKESELGHLPEMVSTFKESIRSLKLEIIKAYTALLDCSSLQSGPCMRDDELVELVDSLIQSLVDLRSSLTITGDIVHHAQVELEALEDKLIFLKNLVRFSILRGTELGQLEDLSTHIHIVSLKAARLCYTCDAIENEHKICSLISKQIPKIEPFDLHLFETCIKILRAPKSSANLQSVVRDKHRLWDFNDSLLSRLWKTRTKILRSPKSSANLQCVVRDEHILWDFNDSLLSRLWGIIQCNFVFMDSVKDQVETLYTGLKFFRNILREPQVKMDQLNEKIGALLSEAGLIVCSLSVNQLKEGEVNSLEARDALDCYGMLINANGGINLIKNQINGSSITGGLPSYHGFKGHEVANSYSLVPSKRKITVTQEIVVGFDDEAETIVNRLLGGSRHLEVIPIVGMPGLGKTTLAKKVNKNLSVMSHFDIRLWCGVSEVYEKKNLILQLLCDDDKYSGMNDDDLLLQLYQMLKERKYLIVFDDVWDIGFWNDLRLSFPKDENGSRILFTSRFSDLASQVEFGKEPHNLRSLSECESWELLQKKVFGNEDCPQKLRQLGKEIAKNCRGLPLTIVIIAGVLATIEDDGWGEVAKSLSSTIVYDTDLCKNTLQMSYEHLPHYLKPCFLYFGAFPEDEEIETEKLMRLWIAEGFVLNTEPKRLEDVAEDYMMNLIGRNLVMVSKEKTMGGVKTCHIHDLLHEFCKSKAKEENFLLMLRGHDELSVFIEPPKLQRLSICSKQEHFKKLRIFCSYLSSLLLFNLVKQHVGLRMADILFICCINKHLRVLDLVAFSLHCGDFPVEITVLVQLRYLAIRGTISVIPPSVANLSNLETFLVQTHNIGSVSLPDTIWNLKKLRHLHIKVYHGCHFRKDIPENATSLHNLDTFSCLEVFAEKSLEKIVKKIPNVRRLWIKLSKAEQSTDYILPLYWLNLLSSLESLDVWSDHLLRNDIEYCFPSTLKELTLGSLFLPWSKISLVEKLPNLEVLKLLSDSFHGDRWDMKGGGFPKLRVLCLAWLDIVEWTDTDCDDNCFPSLEKFQLEYMRHLKKVPSCLGIIPTLKTVEISRCIESIVSLVRRIEEEQQSYGNRNLEMHIEHCK